MGFPRQEYWCGWPFPSPQDRPDPGTAPVSPALADGFLTAEPPGKPLLEEYELAKEKKTNEEKKNHQVGVEAWMSPEDIISRKEKQSKFRDI